VPLVGILDEPLILGQQSSIPSPSSCYDDAIGRIGVQLTWQIAAFERNLGSQ
jgi:hypothetical protein